MSDPVADKSGFLCMYMSGHPDTLVAYAKWYGKVEEPISGAKMTGITSNRITMVCTPKARPTDPFEVVVPIEPPLKSYDDVKPRLLEMKALAQEGLGMLKAPRISSFKFPLNGSLLKAAVFVGLSTIAYLTPTEPPYSPLLLPVQYVRRHLFESVFTQCFYGIVLAHTLESMYTFSLCWKHSSGFVVGAQYVLSTFVFGFPIWSSLRKRIQDARIDSVMKVE